MGFKDLEINLIYDTSQSSVVEKLIIPLLSNTKTYYRGVGYFSSAWIKLVTKGLEELVKNNGKIQLLTSPQLNKDDWDAIINGERAKADMIIYKSILKSIDGFDIQTKNDTLNLFSWLIADGFIDLKFVVCQNIVGNYHDKVAIFEDINGDRVCIHGSLNDSLQATYNGEGISVFKGWVKGQSDYLDKHYQNFMKLSKGENDYYKIYDIPEILKVEFKKYQLTQRPYKNSKTEKKEIHLPKYILELNDYQNTAIEKLIRNNWKGIFEMATGTGKTITAIEASRRYIELNKRVFLIIVVPFKHLISQWNSVLTDFGYDNIVCCYKGLNYWYDNANRSIKNFNAAIQNIGCLVTTYKTASTPDFLKLVKKIRKHSFLIADECHYIGSSKYRTIMIDSIQNRLGLSATPDRWFDDDGTTCVRQYFTKTVFEYDLKTAIENGYLTRYEYHPIIVHLDIDELDEYVDLTKKISKLSAYGDELSKESALKMLLIKRAHILSRANNKKQKLVTMLNEQRLKGKLCHTLVYCASGENKEIVLQISNLNVKVHDFVYDVSDTRRAEILDQFDKGNIETLVAIKCLDEGVDIPSTQSAYFLASTSNPREFVQRRGRVLRKFKGKKRAQIYDFIVMPNIYDDSLDESYDKALMSIISKEIPRFAEFSNNAENKYETREILAPYLSKYDLEYLMDKLPYEIYNNLKLFRDDVEKGDMPNEKC